MSKKQTDDDLVPIELRLKPLHDEAKELQEAIKPLADRLEEIKEDVREMVEGPGTYGKVIVADTTRLDTDALAESYPVKEHPYLYRLTIDPDAAKQRLPQDILERHKKVVGKRRVTFK